MRGFVFLLLAACGSPGPCPSYEAEVAPLITRSCVGCHSASVRGANRQGAPREANYDTYDEVSAVAKAIVDRARDDRSPMPPRSATQPRLSEAEVEVLARWQSCGATP